jgi:hypothetical protein
MNQPLSGPIVHRPKSKPRKVRAREHLWPRASETRSQIRDGRIRDQGLKFETSKTLESEASKTFQSETSEFEALVSETLEFRDWGFEFT